MLTKKIQAYLADKTLGNDEQVLAELCLALADSFDKNPQTGTAAEFRKTFSDLRKMLSNVAEVDPLAEMLRR